MPAKAIAGMARSYRVKLFSHTALRVPRHEQDHDSRRCGGAHRR